MYDSSYNYFTLERQLYRSDFLAHPSLKMSVDRERTIQHSVRRSNDNQNFFIGLKKGNVKGKHILRSTEISDDLIIRKTTQNLRRALNRPTTNRNNAALNCYALLKESTPYLVYRLDIKSFYESFEYNHIKNTLRDLVSPRTRLITLNLIDHWNSMGGKGIPRGLPLGHTLSDLLMEGFDHTLINNDHVYFYARYVDDIVIFTKDDTSPKNFIPFIKESLPPGLAINKRKTHVRYATPLKGQPNLKSPTAKRNFNLEYLGYVFHVTTTGSSRRECHLDIAPSKVRKKKTQIVLAFREFTKNRNFKLLHHRLQYLTSNFSVYDINHHTRRLAGIYYSYPLIDIDQSVATKHLDRFLKASLLSRKGQVSSRFQDATTAAQRRELLTLSFSDGAKNRIFTHFSSSQLRQIQKCWRYVL
ncbi:antiviral reverse transcriptase Drt3a [Arhodomonas aquaeolei]|uniref:antiviral reverse transcriptase Drt3a n=1 Tax=Arhodomonas aquaeolei TaxID=2369 RepID=UPI00039F7EE4|nr:antiviral reverse transcriptase Drt3a [Arhodomonas aquaeolei]